MSFLGQDNGLVGLSNAGGMGEAKRLEPREQPRRHVEAPRWPDAGTVVRVVGLAVVVVVLIGWALTALNA